MSKTLTLAEAKKKFHKITGIKLLTMESGFLLTAQDLLVVVRKFRSPRPKIHVVGAETSKPSKRVAKKAKVRDSNLLSEDNSDLKLCHTLLQEEGPLPRRTVEIYFGWSKRKAGRVLTSMVHHGWALCEGTGTGQYYTACAKKARRR